ncbi:MAG TPA: efflux RND transporter periplasmic adaptor subunit [Vicinamibacterales bacterium]|nr:efflux RND transporter periplasmic adaptor subunit [Vicinamibacterales bacterium]
MTPFTTLQRVGAPLASAVATALVFTTGLWIQHARAGWPFDRPADTPRAESIADMEPTTGANTHNRVPVDAAAARSLDIRLETVGRESLTQTVRAVATIVPDESRISHVHTRVAGWIEHLDVNTTGEEVRAGQPLAHIFSQELLSSQTEYLAARRNTAASGITSSVVASGKTRLGVLGMTADEIAAIEQADEPKRLVTVVAPRSGVVVNRGVTVGTSVDPSTTLLTIADLSRVWVLAEVPEASIPAVRVGTLAQLDFPASGRSPFAARVDFIYPTLTERTRTLRVRLSAGNSGGALRPGLYGTASFEYAGQNVITVPRDAIVDTGLQQHVFVAAGDQFEPRPVVVGAQLADRVEIREGLRQGEQIVAAGVFLLDSESRLRATGGTGGHNHGAPAGKESPTTPNADPHAGHKQSSAESSGANTGHDAIKAPAKPHAGHQE